LIIFSLYGTAQKTEQISETDIPGITVLSGNNFAGEQLNDYLGNTANLCLEYGLQTSCVTEYALNNDTGTNNGQHGVIMNLDATFNFLTDACILPRKMQLYQMALFPSIKNKPVHYLTSLAVKLLSCCSAREISMFRPLAKL